MSKKTLYLLGILLTIIIGTFIYWYMGLHIECCGDGLAENSSNATEQIENNSDTNVTPEAEADPNATIATSNGFALRDASGDFNFSSNDNFNFNVSGFDILKPITTELDGGIDQLKAYLDGNENKAVNITGLFASSETNNSAYPNLGIARANAVKNYFSSRGINVSRMNTEGKQWNDLVPDGAIYKGPVNFGITTATDDSAKKEADALEALEAKIKDNPLVLYFNHSEASISLNAEQRQKIADITRYLDKKEGAILTITGHTDNTATRTTNLRLGKERAEYAKGYFIENGIAESKINTVSKGPDEPIASNDTEEGKSKNRRAEVTIN